MDDFRKIIYGVLIGFILMLVIWISTQVVLIQAIVFLHILYFVWGWTLILLTLTPTVYQHLKR